MPDSTPSPARELPLRVAAIQLVIASFVVLFQELALIRWLAGHRQVLVPPDVARIAGIPGGGISGAPGRLAAQRVLSDLAAAGAPLGGEAG